ncbi:hypothetical protein SteCoe_6622 [Stentor coeruleus]|uniref:Uncharacterized protein n=1 Tax=Stentor coeruleus TaxID=5963 RepID=A0A1R2CPM9_9CILI|nr:hypothetical protein SteCoe_6622 [Stentor coeruleus]
MAGAKTLSFAQICLDLSCLLIIIFSYFNKVFTYMNDYTVRILKITYEFTDPQTKLDAFVTCYYDDFNNYFCDKQPNIEGMTEICDNLDNFKSAGIVYIVISSFAMITIIMSIIHIVARLFEAEKSILLFHYYHLIYPCILGIATACYLGITEIFTLSPPKDKDNDQVSPQIGIAAIFLAQVLSLISMGFYYLTRKKVLKAIKVSDAKPLKNDHDEDIPQE